MTQNVNKATATSKNAAAAVKNTKFSKVVKFIATIIVKIGNWGWNLFRSTFGSNPYMRNYFNFLGLTLFGIFSTAVLSAMFAGIAQSAVDGSLDVLANNLKNECLTFIKDYGRFYALILGLALFIALSTMVYGVQWIFYVLRTFADNPQTAKATLYVNATLVMLRVHRWLSLITYGIIAIVVTTIIITLTYKCCLTAF